MKKFLILILSLFSLTEISAQCAAGPTGSAGNPPTCPGTSTNNYSAGEQHCFTALAGNTYTIETCGNTTNDTQITLFDSGGTSIGYNDDGCGLQSSVSYTPTVDETICFQAESYFCDGTGSDSNNYGVTISCTAAPTGSGCSSPIALVEGDPCVSGDTDINGNILPFSLCGSAYGDGDDDAVYTFTPTVDGFYDILTSQIDDNYAGVFVYENACPNNSSTPCIGNSTNGLSTNDLLVNVEMFAGTTYYIIVTTWGSPFDVGFCIEVDMGIPPVNDCDLAETICDNSAIDYNPTGPGNDDFADPNNDNGCLTGDEHQSAWYYFEMNSSTPPGTTLGFTLTPNAGSGEDYDFAIYGPNVPCDNLGSPIRCSFAGSSCGFCPQTGLGMGETDVSESALGNGFVSNLTVNPGDGFFLLIDNYSATSQGFVLDWNQDGANYLDCTAQPPCGITVDAGPDQNVCAGASGTITLNGSATSDLSDPLTYTWMGTNPEITFLSNINILNPTVTIPGTYSGTITYTLEVTDGNCTETDVIIIDVTQGAIPDAGLDQTMCDGQTVTIGADPILNEEGATYDWSTGDSGTLDWSGNPSNDDNGQIDVSPTTTTTYTVTVTNSDGCTGTDDVTITVENITAAATVNDPTCPSLNDGTITLSTSSGTVASYDWENTTNSTSGSGTTNPITGLEPGSYTITVTDDNGCTAVTNAVLDDPACCGAEAGTITANTPVCPGANITTTPSGWNMDAAYTQVFFIANSGGSILQLNSTGVFVAPTACNTTYTVYSYNYLTAGSGHVPSVGDNVSMIDCVPEPNCCDLESTTFTVEDTEAPTFTNPLSSVTYSCIDDVPAMTDLSWTDNCAVDGTSTGNETGTATACDGGTITRTWEATDDCNNTTTHTQTITIDPADAPTVSLPAGLPTSLDCVNAENFTSAPDATYTNNGSGACLISGNISATVTPNFTACNGGTITIDYNDTDACNNPVTAQHVIAVTPASGPTVSLPAGLPTSLDCDAADAFTSAPDATYTNSESGNCLISGNISASITPDYTACAGGTITIDYNDTDACGNAVTAQHLVTVNAPGSPTVSLPSGLPTTLDCDAADAFTSAPDATYTNNESGNCLISGNISATLTPSYDGCSGGSITIDYNDTDACGNPVTAQHIITVSGASQATLTLPSGLPTSMDCGSANSYTSAPDATYTNNQSGNCLVQGNVSATITPNFDACNGGSITIDYNDTDACGNPLTGQHIITVTGAGAPTLTLPTGLPTSMDCASATSYTSAPDATYTNNESGSCEINGAVSATITPSYDACNGGTITIDYNDTDACGNPLTGQHIITITAASTPTVSLPSGLPTSLDCASADGFTSAADATYSNNESGSCAISGNITASITPSYDACNGGSITIDYNDTDACGNPVTAQHIITVNAASAPTVSLPAGLPASLDCGAAGSFTSAPDATYDNGESGNCALSGNITASLTPSFDACNGGTITIDYNDTDACGNPVTAQHVITVDAASAPTVSLPSGLPTSLDCASADGFTSAADATYSNNESGSCAISGNISATITPNYTACNGGSITIDYNDTDACGNLVTAQHVITVDAASPAAMTLPSGLPTNLDCGQANGFTSAPDATYDNGESGACAISGNVSATITPNFDACSGGTITVDYNDTDPCGNPLTGQHIITVAGAGTPSLTLPSGLPTSLNCGEAINFTSAPDATYDNGESGACAITGNVTATLTPNFDACNGGTITIDYNDTDACGNPLTGQHIITVNGAGTPSVSLPSGLPTSLDCGSADSFTSAPDATFTNGESGTCMISGNITATLTPSYDACNGGTITIDYNDTDACGNPLTAQHVITVLGATAPTVSLPPGLPSDLDCEAALAFTSAADATYDNGESGACAITGNITAVVLPSFDKCNGGSISIDYNETDACGNAVTAQHVITVTAAVVPTLTLPTGLPTSLSCADAPGFTTAPDATYSNNASSTCLISGNISASITPNYNACNGGSILVEYTDTDECGNLLSDQIIITVDPASVPVFQNIPGDVTVDCNSVPSMIDLIYDNGETGSCQITGLETGSDALSGDACTTIITRTWSTLTPCGDNVFAQQIITVVDNEDPTMSPAPGDVSVCEGDEPPMTNLAWTDNCDGGGVVSGTDVSDNQINPETITRTWEYFDACGNSVTETQLIMVYIPLNAGTAEPPLNTCANNSTTIDLNTLLTGQDTGGNWAETSVIPSTGGAFTPVPGTFNPFGQLQGTYTFEYSHTGGAFCPNDAETVTIIIGQPDANAINDGPTCSGGWVVLFEDGGDAVSWSWDGPGALLNPNSQSPNLSNVQPSDAGTYAVTITDVNGCSAVATTEVVVNEIFADASNNGPACAGQDVTLFETSGTAVSWNWDGPGNLDNSSAQNPVLSNVSTSDAGIYSVTITDINGCEDVATTEVIITNISANVTTNSPVCEGDDIILNEDAGDATSWTWETPSGAIFTTQNPVLANAQLDSAGTYNVTVTDAIGCTAVAFADVDVNVTPQGTITGDASICAGESTDLVFNLTGNGPFDIFFTEDAGSGASSIVRTGISDGYTETVSPGVTTTYCLQTINNLNFPICTGVSTSCVTVTVAQPPTVSNVSPVCSGDNSGFTVSFDVSGGDSGSYTVTVNSPQGGPGVWVGSTWISDIINSPGVYDIDVDDNSGCGPVNINGSLNCGCITDAGTMNLAPIEVCGDGPLSAIHNNNESLDGNDIFGFILHDNPGATAGNILQTNATPDFGFDSGSMTYGVTYYISAVAGNDAGGGNIDFGDPCASVASGTPITFNEIPTATLITPDDSICVPSSFDYEIVFTGTGPFDLSYDPGTGATNVFGITNNPYTITLNPTDDITFTLLGVNNASCIGTVSGTANLQVDEVPTVDNITHVCNADNSGYTLSFEVSGGDPTTYTVTDNSPFGIGGTWSGNTWTSDEIPNNTGYSFDVDDIHACGPVNVNLPNFDCGCATDAGTMSATPLQECGNNTVTATHNGDETLDGNDVTEYILHDNPGGTTGNIIATNSTGIFGWQAPMLYGTTYYISLIAGNDDGNGSVDLNDGCLSVAPGQPVMFFEQPVADAGADDGICDDTYTLAAVASVGGGQWTQISGPGTAAFTNSVFSGTEVSVDMYGTYIFEWMETNNSCMDSDEVEITFAQPTSSINLTEVCDATNSTYTVSFEITGGTGTFTIVSGGGMIAGNIYTSDPIPTGTPYNFEITDGTLCQNLIVAGSYACGCTTNAGTMSSTLLEVCGENCADAATHNMDEILDGNDILQYVLHEGSGTVLQNPIETNNTGVFCFQPSMMLGTTYYISVIAGSDDGNGNVDLSDPCLSVAAGQPVIFHEVPVANAGTDDAVCDLVYNLNAVPSVGSGQWSQTSGPGTSFFGAITSASSSVTVSEYGVYTFEWSEDNNACANADEVEITFSEPMDFANLSQVCDATNTNYTVSFEITGGSGTFTIVSGGGTLSGNVYTSELIPNGDPYAIEISDGSACPNLVVTGTHNCACATDAGTMASTLLEVCGDNCAQAATHNNDEVLDANDITQYVLHEGSSNILQNSIEINNTGVFCFQAGMSYGTTYYISLIAGDDDGSGAVDLTDGCLSVAVGQPVIFYENPVANAGVDDTVCDFTYNLNAVASVGTGQWTQTTGPGTSTFADATAANTSVTVTQLGSYTFTWTENNNNCIQSDGVDITFIEPLNFTNITHVCDPTNTNYTVSFEITGGDGNYSIVSGGGVIVGNTYTSDPIPSNVPYSIEIQDGSSCANLVVPGTFDCACATDAGTMASTLLEVCGDGCAPAATHNDDEVLDGNDILVYILHEGNANVLQNVIESNTTGIFCHQPGINYGTTYYISAVAGNMDNGDVDLSDPCLSVSIGQPVIWYEQPLANAGADDAVCDLNYNMNATASAGIGTWTQTSGPGTATFANANDPASLVSVDQNGTYTFQWSEDNAICMDADEVMISFNNSTTNNITASICIGQDYIINGVSYSTTGIHTETISGGNTQGCDSIIVLDLTVNNAITNTIDADICDGQDYVINGVPYSIDGTHTETIIGGSVGGCDSIIVLNLTVNTEVTNNISASICTGQDYIINGVPYSTTGIHTETLPGGSSIGCDSVIVLDLSVNDAVTNNIAASICDGQDYIINGVPYNTNGIHTETLPGGSSIGCDSIIVLDLNVNPATTNNLTASICTGQDYIINGVPYSTTGIHTEVIPGGNANGCDSTIVLDLTVNTQVTNDITASICTGQDYIINGVPYSTTGIHTEMIPGGSSAGCDSVIVLDLTVSSIVTFEYDQTICYHETYTFDGQVLSQSGQYVETITGGAQGGCDSVTTLNLTILPVSTEMENHVMCVGDSLFFNEAWLFDSGTYLDTFFYSNGCDSVHVTLNLQVQSPIVIDSFPNVCIGDIFKGQVITADVLIVEKDPPGPGEICEIVYNYHVSAREVYNDTSYIYLCEGDSIFLDGNWQFSDGIFMEFNTSIWNCDSTEVTVLEFDSPLNTVGFIEACEGTDVFVNGQLVTVSGIYTDTMLASSGICDSIFGAEVVFIDCTPTDNAVATMTSCNGSSDGSITLTMNGGQPPYIYTYTNPDGTTTGSGNIDPGDPIVITGLPADFYVFTVTDDYGNQIFVDVTVTEPTAITTTTNQTLEVSCYGLADAEATALANGGTPNYIYTWENGMTGQNVSGLDAGWHVITITDANNCATMDSIFITEPDPLLANTTIQDPNCPNSNDGLILVDSIIGGSAPYLYALNGNPLSGSSLFGNLSSGTYSVQVEDTDGCTVEIDNIELAEPDAVALSHPTLEPITLGESTTLDLTIDGAYDSLVWSPAVGLSCTDCIDPVADPLVSTTYSVTVFYGNGCFEVLQARVTIQDPQVFVPNIFTPNTDGTNEFVPVFAGSGVERINVFRIFNRWGEMVYEATNFFPNDPTQGWDGTFKGKKLNPAVFVYFLEAQFIDGRTGFYEGDITLKQ